MKRLKIWFRQLCASFQTRSFRIGGYSVAATAIVDRINRRFARFILLRYLSHLQIP